MIVILDYGMGNLRSVLKRLARFGFPVEVSSHPEDVERATALVIPGVGSFQAGMENLRRSELLPVLHHRAIEDRIPVLGICLGMQLFTRWSEEGDREGLGWIDAETRRFRFPEQEQRVPHVGWNDVRARRESPLFAGIPTGSPFYFTHSYHVCCADSRHVLATTTYGYEFTSALHSENLYGTQFHPEKSHRVGIQLIRNFLEQVGCPPC